MQEASKEIEGKTAIENTTSKPITVKYRIAGNFFSKRLEADESMSINYSSSDPIEKLVFQMEGFPAQEIPFNQIPSFQGNSIIELTPSPTQGFNYEVKIFLFDLEEEPKEQRAPIIPTVKTSSPMLSPRGKGITSFESSKDTFPFIEPKEIQQKTSQGRPFSSEYSLQELFSQKPVQPSDLTGSIHTPPPSVSQSNPLIKRISRGDEYIKTISIEVMGPNPDVFGTKKFFQFGMADNYAALPSPLDIASWPAGTTLTFKLTFFSNYPSVQFSVTKEQLMKKLENLTGEIDLEVSDKSVYFVPHKQSFKPKPMSSSSSQEDISSVSSDGE